MAGILDIGVSALKTQQAALRVTGNNIANANNEDYNRQRLNIDASRSELKGSGYYGTGVDSNGVYRALDQFAIKQVWLDTATNASYSSAQPHYEKLDLILSDKASSLAPRVEQAFTALEAAAKDPKSEPLRQVAMSKLSALSNNFNKTYDNIVNLKSNLQDQIEGVVTKVNELASEIVNHNIKIKQASQGPGKLPNDLLDARDALVGDLSKLIDINTIKEPDGDINIYIGKGQPLVLSVSDFPLGVQKSSTETGSIEIVSNHDQNSRVEITSSITGGEIGGLLKFREKHLEPTLNSLGRLSLAIADSLNQQNRQGLDLNSNFGNRIFTDINSEEMQSNRASTNVGSAILSVQVNDIKQLKNDNYDLSVIGNGPPMTANLVNKTTKEAIQGTMVPVDLDNNPATPDVMSFVPNDANKTEGISIYVKSGTLAVGDEYSIKPARNASTFMRMELTDPRTLAFAAPITTVSSNNNRGAGVISQGKVIEAADKTGTLKNAFTNPGQLTPPISITFTSETAYQVFDSSTDPQTLLFTGTMVPGQKNNIFDGSDNPVVPNPAAGTPGQPNYLSPIYMGYQVELSGHPKAGDKFSIGFNNDAVSDNRNGLLLSEMREKNILSDGQESIDDVYGRTIEKVGVATSENRISAESSNSIMQASLERKNGFSGVNMDEEAANLIKFEQAYNASAQVITVARSIFDTLINSVS